MLSIQALRLPTLSFLAGGGGGVLGFYCVSDIRAHYGFNFGKCPLSDTELRHHLTAAKCHRVDGERPKHGCLLAFPPTSVGDAK